MQKAQIKYYKIKTIMVFLKTTHHDQMFSWECKGGSTLKTQKHRLWKIAFYLEITYNLVQKALPISIVIVMIKLVYNFYV
jgi:hypothetical protein